MTHRQTSTPDAPRPPLPPPCPRDGRPSPVYSTTAPRPDFPWRVRYHKCPECGGTQKTVAAEALEGGGRA